MKKFLIFLIILNAVICSHNCAFAQIPQAIPYQAVARDNGGNLLANQIISLRISIRDVNATGTIQYRETHNTTTNVLGLFTVNIGTGTPVTGSFAGINWATNAKFMQVEMDAAGGTSFIDMGTQQMLSVPYALNSADNKWTATGSSISNNNSGNVGIGINTPDPSARMEISSSTSGFLLPRMTGRQRNEIVSPATGLMIYCTDCGTGGQLQFFQGVTWSNMVGASPINSPMTQIGTDINGEALNDASGHVTSLSSDGTRLAIGAPVNGGNGSASGHVRIYQESVNSWSQIGADINGEAIDDRSGISVSLSADGTRVAIGALFNDGNGANSGHVRIYQWNGNAWSQLGADIDGEAADDNSGQSVSLSSNGNRVAIGAPGNDGNGSGSGHVRIYQWNGSTWNQLGADINGIVAGEASGRSVSLSFGGDTVAIGAPSYSVGFSGAGRAGIYVWNGTAWSQLGGSLFGGNTNLNCGYSLSLSSAGNRIAIGSPNGIGSGRVGIYQWNGSAWSEFGIPAFSFINGEATDDGSGESVSLSSDGNRVAIGADANDGNGSNSGHVRIYDYLSTGNVWVQLFTDINGEASNDQSGTSVSLSSNGIRVAIGAPFNDGNGSNSGHVRVYY